MNPFPAEYELVGLFESDPVLLDPLVPWAYNRLQFSRSMGESTIECVIEPGYETLKVRWIQGGAEVVNLDLRCVFGLTVELENDREALKAHFRDDRGVSPVSVQLKPTIHISWGTTQDLA